MKDYVVNAKSVIYLLWVFPDFGDTLVDEGLASGDHLIGYFNKE